MPLDEIYEEARLKELFKEKVWKGELIIGRDEDCEQNMITLERVNNGQINCNEYSVKPYQGDEVRVRLIRSRETWSEDKDYKEYDKKLKRFGQ